jgi:hypothetical protein
VDSAAFDYYAEIGRDHAGGVIPPIESGHAGRRGSGGHFLSPAVVTGAARQRPA